MYKLIISISQLMFKLQVIALPRLSDQADLAANPGDLSVVISLIFIVFMLIA